MGVVNLDVEAKRRLESSDEELNPLVLVQEPRAWEERLETVLVLLHGARAFARRQFAEWVGSEGRTVAEVEQILEAAPGRSTLVLLDLDVPHLCPVLQVVQGHPDLLLLELLEPRRPVQVVLPGGGPGARGRQWRSVHVQALNRLGVGIDGGLQRLQGGGQGVQGGLECGLLGAGVAEWVV